MDKLKEFLKDKPIWVQIIILICCGILVYFASGCSLKADAIHFENFDGQIGKPIHAIYGVNHGPRS